MGYVTYLSVNELGGNSNLFGADVSHTRTTIRYDTATTRITVNAGTRELAITTIANGYHTLGDMYGGKITLDGIDLDDLIEFLQAAKEFLHEEDMVDALKGK